MMLDIELSSFRDRSYSIEPNQRWLDANGDTTMHRGLKNRSTMLMSG